MASNTITSAISSTYLAAEYLVRMIGQEAAEAVKVAPMVWRQDLVGASTMVAHFRFLDALGDTSPSATENAALTELAWSPEGVTVTCGLYGNYTEVPSVTDSIAPDALSQIASQHGSKLGRAVDSSLTALFPSLTAGTVGTAGAALTWANIVLGESYLDASFAIGKRYGFIAPHQYYNLKSDIASKNFGVGRTTTDAFGNETIEIGSTTLYKSALVGKDGSNTNFAGAILTEQALGLAIAMMPGVKILPVPTHSSYSVESTIAYGVGVIRPTFGVLVRSGVSA